jgi:hypothetical protein
MVNPPSYSQHDRNPQCKCWVLMRRERWGHMDRAQPAGKPDARWKTRAGRCANILMSSYAFAATVAVVAAGTGSLRSLKSLARDFRSNTSSNDFVTLPAGAIRRTGRSIALVAPRTAKPICVTFAPTWRRRTCRRGVIRIARNCRLRVATRLIPRSHIGGQHRQGGGRPWKQFAEQARR